jgi:hypothetical protein
MDPRERFDAFWSGERPDQIPYSIYWNEWRHTALDPAWRPMFDAGLRVTYGCMTAAATQTGVEHLQETVIENGRTIERQTQRTPVGEIHFDRTDGWATRRWLQTADDYRVMKYIVEHTDHAPNYDAFAHKEREVADHGIVHTALPRTPIQTILVDYVGLEQFALHLFDLEEPMMELYDALLANFALAIEIVAEGPSRYVSCLENFTAETMGPERFAQLHMPVYDKFFPMLQQAGKVVGTHYDGRLASCSHLVAQAPIDLIESLTPPPEGDMELSDCRAAWPDKLFWSNINVSAYELPPGDLKQLVLDRVAQAAPDGAKLAFEVSEQYPQNWKESMLVVLDALRETRE